MLKYKYKQTNNKMIQLVDSKQLANDIQEEIDLYEGLNIKNNEDKKRRPKFLKIKIHNYNYELEMINNFFLKYIKFEKLNNNNDREKFIKQHSNYDVFFAMAFSYILKQDSKELTFSNSSMAEIKKMKNILVSNDNILAINSNGINSILFTDIEKTERSELKKIINFGSVYKIAKEVDRMLNIKFLTWDFDNMLRLYEIVDLLLLDNEIINKDIFDFSLLDEEFKNKFKLFKMSFV